MNCDTCRDLIPLAVLNELTVDQKTPFGLHLSSCERCRAEFDNMNRTVRQLDPDPRDDLTEIEKLRLENTILKRLKSGSADRPVRKARANRVGTAILRIAAALVLFLLGLFAAPHLKTMFGNPPQNAEAPLPGPCVNISSDAGSGWRFSAKGFKVLAHGRDAVTREDTRQLQ